MPTATSNGVGLRDIDALRKEISMLTGSVTASKQAHDQLTHQVATLSTVVTDVQHDTSVLKQDATKLQNMLRDAASLAGTVKVLCGAHKQHQHQFEAYVRQQYARIDASRRHIKQRHQRIHSQSTSLEDVSVTSDGEGQWGPSSGSESSFRLTTVYDSSSWISKWLHWMNQWQS